MPSQTLDRQTLDYFLRSSIKDKFKNKADNPAIGAEHQMMYVIDHWNPRFLEFDFCLLIQMIYERLRDYCS